MEKTKMDFNEALTLFVTRLQAHINDHFAKNFPRSIPTKIGLVHGSKFVKVVELNDQGKPASVHSFVVKKAGTTKTLGTVKVGDVLKAASWSAPARHVRGSIFAEDFSGYGVSTWGTRRL